MLSYEAQVIPLRDDTPENRRMARGITLWQSIERARTQGNRRPFYGDAFIAEMVIPLDDIQVEKTGGAQHYTAWGDPDDMLECVTHLERV